MDLINEKRRRPERCQREVSSFSFYPQPRLPLLPTQEKPVSSNRILKAYVC